MTVAESTGTPSNGCENGTAAYLADIAIHRRKFWRLAVLVVIVIVAWLVYTVYVQSVRAEDLQQKREEIVRLQSEKQALLDERATLVANLDQLKLHVLSLTSIIETLSGGEITNPHGG